MGLEVDGERFETSSKTVKLVSGIKYRITVKVVPATEF